MENVRGMMNLLIILFCISILFLAEYLTCIIVMCSRIHMWREEASSLNCSNFLWASASNRGWPGGGSGKTS